MAYRPYPPPKEIRVGIKVSWNYYDNEDDAKACSPAARHNARIREAAGYDFGYQSPGNVRPPSKGSFYPELWEVCLP